MICGPQLHLRQRCLPRRLRRALNRTTTCHWTPRTCAAGSPTGWRVWRTSCGTRTNSWKRNGATPPCATCDASWTRKAGKTASTSSPTTTCLARAPRPRLRDCCPQTARARSAGAGPRNVRPPGRGTYDDPHRAQVPLANAQDGRSRLRPILQVPPKEARGKQAALHDASPTPSALGGT